MPVAVMLPSEVIPLLVRERGAMFGCRQHHDAGCARGQTSTPCPHLSRAREYTDCNEATVGANSGAECKSQDLTRCTDQCAGADGTSHAGTDLCVSTTRPCTDSAGLSANRCGTGRWRDCTDRCRPCVGADRIRCDYTACRDRDRGALITPGWRVDQRCCPGIGDQLQDCAADRGGCRRASAGTARGGFLRCTGRTDPCGLARSPGDCSQISGRPANTLGTTASSVDMLDSPTTPA